MALLIVFLLILAIDLLVALYGADSRDGRDWN